MKDFNSSKMDKVSPEIMNETSLSRRINIKTSMNKMEAYLTIQYSVEKEGESPKPFTLEELRSAIHKAGIVYGVLEEKLIDCLSAEGCSDVLFARGTEPIEGENDTIDIKFAIDSDIRKLNEDSKGRIDFKSIGAISSALPGEIIALRKPGHEGQDGADVMGKPIKAKQIKIIKLKAAQGCELKDENTVIAAIEGKPSMKNNTFYVHRVHEVRADVDLKTGNIDFVGDIAVNGSVREGMKVNSGNSVNINQNVEMAEVRGRGDIIISGNVINSTVVAGGQDSAKLNEITDLNLFVKTLGELVAAVEEIKKFNLLGYDTSDGQIIKVLLESKFKIIPKLCISFITHAVRARQDGDLEVDKLLLLIKSKLVGLAPISIRHYSELLEIIDTVRQRLEVLKSSVSIPVNIKLSYCQDSKILSSGDVIVSGKGAIVSSITAQNNIYFTQENSVVRGGGLKAEKEIRCKVTGSQGGAPTKLVVGEHGHIWIKAAFENTVIIVGNKEFLFDYASKDVHAYINDKYELIIDRLRL